jgi:hypothetical protein
VSEIRRPVGLKATGKRLWRDIAGVYDLRPDEGALLAHACRQADEIQELEDALADCPMTVASYPSGSVKAHPLFNQLRLLRLAQARLLGQLQLSDVRRMRHPEGEKPNKLDELRMRRAIRMANPGPGFPVGYVRCPNCSAELEESARVEGGVCPACGYDGDPPTPSLWSIPKSQRLKRDDF